MHALFMIALACAAQTDGPSVASVQRVIIDQYDLIADLSCEYEGRLYSSKMKGPTKLGLDQMIFSGFFALGSEKQSIAVEQYQFFTDPKFANNNSHRLTISRDGKIENLYEDARGNQSGDISGNWALTFDSSGSLERVIPINAVRCYFSDSNYLTKFDGFETIDGHPCDKISVHLTPDAMKKFRADNSLIVIYWFDLERGAFPLRVDFFLNRPKIHSRVTDVVLRQFKQQERRYWFPVEGKKEFLDDDGSVEVMEYYQVLPQSVTISPLPTDRFSAKFKPGTPITDELRKARYEFGQDLRPPAPTRSEAETRLKEHLSKANSQKELLDASRVANEASGWFYWVVLGGSALGLTFVSLVLIRRR